MTYRIKDDIGIRSWQFVPYAYIKKGELPARPLSEDEFDLIRLLDGETDIAIDDKNKEIIEGLILKGVIEPCKKGEKSSSWSSFKEYKNRHFPKMNFMITGKCNYNCIHCFNASDLSALNSEWDFNDAKKLIFDAADCGVLSVSFTGGEPFLFPGFIKILKAVEDAGMFVEEINTNGHFIDQRLLDEIKTLKFIPRLKISFDGIYSHDFMRNKEGIKDRTINAIKLSVKNGFDTMVQMQVNKKNEGELLETAKFLNKTGVKTLRLIRTTETARWREKGKEIVIQIDEYYEKMLIFSREFNSHIKSLPEDEINTYEVIIWQFLTLYPKEMKYKMYPVRFKEGEYRDTYAVCQGNRGMIGVMSNGDLIPCLQMSGYFLEHNIKLSNLHEKPLNELLLKSDYLDMVTANLYKLKHMKNKCNTCEFYKYCAGGCRALALLYAKEEDGFFAEDPLKCKFFFEGWYDKVKDAFKP